MHDGPGRFPGGTARRPASSRGTTTGATRKPLPLWDRIKFLLLLTLVWFILVWAAMADNPLLPFSDAIRIEARAGLVGVRPVRPGGAAPDPLPDQ